MSRLEHMIDTPTKGRFRQRVRNEIYFYGSDKPHERPGMYAFWTAFVHDPTPWKKRPHEYTRVPARARVGLSKIARFDRMKTDAIIIPENRSYYRALHKSLKKPYQIRRSDLGEIGWWLKEHPELFTFARFPKYRKHGVHNPWQ